MEAKAGLVVNRDAQGLSNALLALLEGTLLGKDMGERGHRLMAERFTWKAAGDKMVQVYRQILSKRDLLTEGSQAGSWRLA